MKEMEDLLSDFVLIVAMKMFRGGQARPHTDTEEQKRPVQQKCGQHRG